MSGATRHARTQSGANFEMPLLQQIWRFVPAARAARELLQLSPRGFFKGAPAARHARAKPAQSDRELKTRSTGEECVRECERDHLVLNGE